jgi:hypothetical protein
VRPSFSLLLEPYSIKPLSFISHLRAFSPHHQQLSIRIFNACVLMLLPYLQKLVSQLVEDFHFSRMIVGLTFGRKIVASAV